MNISFIKMHAQGNDFIIIDKALLSNDYKLYSDLAKAICDRHKGIGADGLVILDKSGAERPAMEIINSDGSRAEMCGSALRCCCAMLARDSHRVEVEILTDNGISKGYTEQDNPNNVTVEIGKPVMVIHQHKLEGFVGDYVRIGNPHFVIVTDDLEANPHLTSGRLLSENNWFEQGANIEFIKIISRDVIEMVVWERGAGATLACGTGATASVFSGQYNQLLNDTVLVKVPGGNITISKKDDVYYLGGEVAYVATGEYLWIA